MAAPFASLKSALGWYAAWRRGPQLASCDIAPRVQDGKLDAGGLWERIAGCISASPIVDRYQLEKILEWAQTSDEAGPVLTRADKDARAVLRAELVNAGLIDPPVIPLPTVDRVFVDADTGEVRRTKARA